MKPAPATPSLSAVLAGAFGDPDAVLAAGVVAVEHLEVAQLFR